MKEPPRKDVDEFLSDFLRFYMLMILYEGPRHGYSLIRALKTRLKRDISPSLVYPFLKSLEKKGLARSFAKPVGEKQRKIYELTDEGRDMCNKLFARFASLVSTAIEPSLAVCAHCGCKIYEGGYLATIDGTEIMFCCEHCAKHYEHERRRTGREPLFRKAQEGEKKTDTDASTS